MSKKEISDKLRDIYLSYPWNTKDRSLLNLCQLLAKLMGDGWLWCHTSNTSFVTRDCSKCKGVLGCSENTREWQIYSHNHDVASWVSLWILKPNDYRGFVGKCIGCHYVAADRCGMLGLLLYKLRVKVKWAAGNKHFTVISASAIPIGIQTHRSIILINGGNSGMWHGQLDMPINDCTTRHVMVA